MSRPKIKITKAERGKRNALRNRLRRAVDAARWNKGIRQKAIAIEAGISATMFNQMISGGKDVALAKKQEKIFAAIDRLRDESKR